MFGDTSFTTFRLSNKMKRGVTIDSKQSSNSSIVSIITLIVDKFFSEPATSSKRSLPRNEEYNQ